mmetsp:Transcript_19175/g.3095  ORF Transcript_19175/g.3095 Transcript_19175/m.3095 type:complete len:91 (+) Transcript_19175:228-500(+)|eukprot:CAMPEP_0168313782 /NCGR_PEP_ID=MMETSP0210-20121227/4400_1 /TAXON_ID=40633 /ORGANISM="Condylostoma magnum, Strain COL2" /LENGTH=90 /DNA_ID=CAMNT_0008274913 /DNA_START=984 /DNA_END=1256 /DNA_ORIENTATION=-
MLKDHPCKVVEINTAKVGKHGAAKSKLTGIDIFTGNKYEEIFPGGHMTQVPNVTRTEYTLFDIESDGFMQLMAENNAMREDLRLPTDETG